MRLFLVAIITLAIGFFTGTTVGGRLERWNRLDNELLCIQQLTAEPRPITIEKMQRFFGHTAPIDPGHVRAYIKVRIEECVAGIEDE